MWNKIVDFVNEMWNHQFIKVAICTLGFIFIWWLTGKIVKGFKKRAYKKTKEKLLVSVITTCILWLLRIGYIIIYASLVGINTAGFAAIIASAGVAIGLALQGSLSNLAGGIMLALTRPFQLGDYIDGAGVSGTVEEMHLFYTQLVTPDNKVEMVPNGTLANSVIINYSKKELRRVDLTFAIAYEDDVDKAINLIKEVCNQHNLILKDNEPFVKEAGHDASSVSIVTRVWVKNEDYWTVHFDLLKSVRKTFDENSITIPYQQIDIHTK